MEGTNLNQNLSEINQENQIKKTSYNKGQYQHQHQYKKNKNFNKNLPVEKIDPYTVQMIIYKAEMYILLKYPHLAEVNKKHEGTSKNFNENSKFFVVSSKSEEDVHKSIKYNVWTASSKNGNQTLNEAFKSTPTEGSVYLIFSCSSSGRFLGMAKMQKEVEYDKFFPFWTQDNQWGGIFEVEWISIKDVPYREFKQINIKMRDEIVRPVSFARDSQEVPFEEGKKIIEIFENYTNTNTILEHFEYYDIRQENYERMFPIQQQFQNLNQNMQSDAGNSQLNG